MANVICSVNSVGYIDGVGVQIGLSTCYSGEDVPNSCLVTPVDVVIESADSPQTIKDKMVAALTEVATTNSLTITTGGITLPSFEKG